MRGLDCHILMSVRCSFFVHKAIEAFAEAIVKRHGSPTEKAFLFPSNAVAARCVQFIHDQVPLLDADLLRIVDLCPKAGFLNSGEESDTADRKPIISAVCFPRGHAKIAKTFWQHSGDGISSRRAEYCHEAFDDGKLMVVGSLKENTIVNGFISPSKGPRRYRKKESLDSSPRMQNESAVKQDGRDPAHFVEERFGRNLDVSLVANAKRAIRRRIAGALTANVDLHESLEITKPSTRTEHVQNFSEDDVYLHPCGMSSIFNCHRIMIACRGPMKSISFG